MPIQVFLLFSVRASYDVLLSMRRHFMPHDQFAEVARQLDETLSELDQISDPALRRSLLGTMRLLIEEADRLAGRDVAEQQGFQPACK